MWKMWKMLIAISQRQKSRFQSAALVKKKKPHSETQRLFIFCHKWRRKAANPHIWEAGTNRRLTFLSETKLLIDCFVSRLFHTTIISFLQYCSHYFCLLSSALFFFFDKLGLGVSGPQLVTEIENHELYSLLKGLLEYKTLEVFSQLL